MSAAFAQCCYVLAVPNVEASQRFYVDVLGFEALDIPAPGWRFVQRGPARIDMGECVDAMPARDLGDHSWFARIFVAGLDAYHDEIAPRGAQVFDGPRDKPWGLREFGVHTPDGHRILFCELIGGH